MPARAVRWTETGDVQHVAKTDDGRWSCIVVTGDGRGTIAFTDGGFSPERAVAVP